MREVGVWLNVTHGRMSPTAQAALIQMGLRGTARQFAMEIPPVATTYGAQINGTMTDPVTYVMYSLANRYEALEDQRVMQSGTAVLDCVSRSGERMDSLLARFGLARFEADSVGAGMHNYHTLTTILLRSLSITPDQMINLLQPNGGQMPRDQIQYDLLVSRIRSMGHILEHAPGNI